MTEITQADKDAADKAQWNAVVHVGSLAEAFVRHREKAIEALQEQHEAYKQDVSDAVEMISNTSVSDDVWRTWATDCLKRFIIPKPTVDPLVEALAELDWFNSPTLAADIHEGLAKRGLKIVETFTRSDDA